MLIKMQMLKHATWGLLVQLQGWFPSKHTHHAWVLLEKFLSWDFWLLEKPRLLQSCPLIGISSRDLRCDIPFKEVVVKHQKL